MPGRPARRMALQLAFHALGCFIPAVFLLSEHGSAATYFPLLAACALSTVLLHHGFRWEIVGIRYKVAAYGVFYGVAALSIGINDTALFDGGFLAAFFLVLVIAFVVFSQFHRSKTPDGDVLDIASPLAAERWVVSQGGSNIIHNYHRIVEAQKEALDLVVIDSRGTRAKGLLPDQLFDYYSYGRKVVSPIDGVVEKIRNSEDDLPIGTADDANPLGNFILIHAENKTLLLAHLMKGSISVGEGCRVSSGYPIGRIGNSGNTTEPHLHIHAIAGYELEEEKIISEGRPIPITVDCRYLRKGDIFS